MTAKLAQIQTRRSQALSVSSIGPEAKSGVFDSRSGTRTNVKIVLRVAVINAAASARADHDELFTPAG